MSVTSNYGTFTFFNEYVTKCQVQKKCWQRGEILAPITNSRDAKKITELLDSNLKGCRIGSGTMDSF